MGWERLKRRTVLFGLAGTLVAALLALFAGEAAAAAPVPSVNLSVGQANGPQDVAVTLQILALLTILTLAPGILMMTTSVVHRPAGLVNLPPVPIQPISICGCHQASTVVKEPSPSFNLIFMSYLLYALIIRRVLLGFRPDDPSGSK